MRLVTFFNTPRAKPKATRKLKEGVFFTPFDRRFLPNHKAYWSNVTTCGGSSAIRICKIETFFKQKKTLLEFLHPQP